jgi:hypothetical protein
MATPFDFNTTATAVAVKPASEAAISYCGALMLEKATTAGADVEAATASIYGWLNGRSAREVSDSINRLKGEGFTGRAAATAALEDGMYVRSTDGVIFKVYVTRSGQQVAKRAEVTVVGTDDDGKTVYEAEMVYEGKAPLRTLDATMRMSMDEARQFGALYSHCCICGEHLENELSVALGIGPVCGGREFGGTFKVMVKTERKRIKDAAKVA